MNMKKIIFLSILALLITSACSMNKPEKNNEDTYHLEAINDPHSYANINEVRTVHLHLDLDVNFDNKTIYGVARHEISQHDVDYIIFDIKGLEILKTSTGKDKEQLTDYVIGKNQELLGQSLRVAINENTKFVNIYYQTTKKTEALDWLSPELTSGKNHPFLYTQGQAILTRSWIPLQDSPMNRISYSADVKVPKELIALMSASNPLEKNDSGQYHFEMKQKIPSYLIALAVGDMTYIPLGDNCGVYAEKELESACEYEFHDLPKMIKAASNLYGDYKWEQYDIVMLPFSFPFGGMENPRLTFANPTLLTGDRSSTSVIAHELAHSWSGNLVTNSTWDDFWLNEGFTVYFENRIMEELYGKSEADILATIEYQDLVVALEEIENSEHPEDTQLKLQLKDRSPDEGMTDIAYVKGAFFLRTLEKAVSREKLDEFLKAYFNDHSFQSITTEVFVNDLNTKLLEPNSIEFNTEEWIYKQGMPENHVKIESKRLESMISIANDANGGMDVTENQLKSKNRNDFTTQEWLAFIRSIKSNVSHEFLSSLDEQFLFSSEANALIKSDWFKLCAKSKYRSVQPKMEAYLIKIGRRWFVEGIYQLLMDSDELQDHEFALSTFNKAKNGYHFVTRSTVAEIVN